MFSQFTIYITLNTSYVHGIVANSFSMCMIVLEFYDAWTKGKGIKISPTQYINYNLKKSMLWANRTDDLQATDGLPAANLRLERCHIGSIDVSGNTMDKESDESLTYTWREKLENYRIMSKPRLFINIMYNLGRAESWNLYKSCLCTM